MDNNIELIDENNRDASASMNGYCYQRYYAINLILDYKNDSDLKYVKEEGWEDVDFININNDRRKVYQMKYYKNGSPESLTCGSGLFKVIQAEYINNDKLDKIFMCVYCEGNSSYTSIKKYFDDHNYDLIRKYFLMIYHNEIVKKNKISIRSNMKKDSIVNLYNKNEKRIKNIKSIKPKYELNDVNALINFFMNREECNKYLEKIELHETEDFDTLKNNICDKIHEEFKFFYNDDQSDDYKVLKTAIIINKFFDILNDKMFNDNDRKLRISSIFDEIKMMIDTFRNTDNLIIEIFDSLMSTSKINTLKLSSREFTRHYELIESIVKIRSSKKCDVKIRKLTHYDIFYKLGELIPVIYSNGLDTKPYKRLLYELLHEYPINELTYSDLKLYNSSSNQLLNCYENQCDKPFPFGWGQLIESGMLKRITDYFDMRHVVPNE